MGKLSAFLAQRKDLEFDYEREVRSVRDLLRGVVRLEGRELSLSLTSNDSFVSEGHARAILLRELEATLRDVLIRYVHNLCLEGCRLGMSSILFEEALRSSEVAEGTRTGQAMPAAAEPAVATAMPIQPPALPTAPAEVAVHPATAAGTIRLLEEVLLEEALSAARAA